MYSEDDLLPLSAIQHVLFCERQCALIHLERLWEENRLTAEGRLIHERAEERARENRGDIRIVRGLEIRSLRLGLVGVADVVEFHRLSEPDPTSNTLIKLPDATGWWRPFPVEYKRGRPKPGSCDEAQLCAQAICLEEMLNVRVEQGALFYYSIRRRTDVTFNDPLRLLCEEAALKLRNLMASQITPPAVDDPRCEHCSLFDLCSPRASSGKKSVQGFIDNQVEFQTGKRS
jgi:CRISPR-associated exonuclease Cas4